MTKSIVSFCKTRSSLLFLPHSSCPYLQMRYFGAKHLVSTWYNPIFSESMIIFLFPFIKISIPQPSNRRHKKVMKVIYTSTFSCYNKFDFIRHSRHQYQMRLVVLLLRFRYASLFKLDYSLKSVHNGNCFYVYVRLNGS